MFENATHATFNKHNTGKRKKKKPSLIYRLIDSITAET